jgi:hypothetical protein
MAATALVDAISRIRQIQRDVEWPLSRNANGLPMRAQWDVTPDARKSILPLHLQAAIGSSPRANSRPVGRSHVSQGKNRVLRHPRRHGIRRQQKKSSR